MTMTPEALADLAKEYRLTMDKDVVHSWASDAARKLDDIADALRTGHLVLVDDAAVERYRHKKRGTVYNVIGTAELQVANTRYTPGEGDSLVLYRGEDGKLWARWDEEFHDGRFEQVKP